MNEPRIFVARALLRLLDEKGPTYRKTIWEELGKEGKEALVRLKARGLVVTRRESEWYYKYDITDLGKSILDILNEENPKVPKFPNT